MSAHPNPGSDEALKHGCTCPVMDNHYGKGIWIRGTECFYINENCPLHVSENDSEEKLEGRDSMYSEMQEAREIEADREFERLDRGMLP